MRFLTDRAFLWNSSSAKPSCLYVADGRIYVGQDNTSQGLSIIDFVNDKVWTITTGGLYHTGPATNKNLSDRFITNNTDFTSQDLGLTLTNGNIHDVSVQILTDEYISVGTDSGANVIKNFDNSGSVYDSTCTDKVSNVVLTDNELYFVSSDANDIATLHAIYGIPASDFGNGVIYGEGDTEGPLLLENKINDLYVVTGQGATDNTLYLATTKGLVQIDEDQTTKSAGIRTIFTSSESTEAEADVKVFAGPSDNVTAVYVNPNSNQLWAGTLFKDSYDRSFASLSVIDTDAATPTLINNSQPKLPAGAINALDDGVVATNGGVLLFDAISMVTDPIEIRARSIYAYEGGYNDPNRAASDWTEWFTDSGTELTDPNIMDPNSISILGRSRYLELEVRLNLGGTDTTPVLESITIGYTPQDLAIDVTIKNNSNVQVADVGRILITKDQMGSNDVITFPLTFNTSQVVPDGYQAWARLIDRITGATIEDANDIFTVSPIPNIEQIIDNHVTTDKRSYHGGERMVITSIVINESDSVPVSSDGDDLFDVKVYVYDPSGIKVFDEPFSYTIDSLQPGSTDVQKFYVDIDIENEKLSPSYDPNLLDYTVKQIVDVPGVNIDLYGVAPFNILCNCDNLTAMSGSITVDPQFVGIDRNILNISISAQNTGNIDLSDVKLMVTIDNLVDDPNYFKPPFIVGSMTPEESTSFSWQDVPAELSPGTYMLELSAEYICDGEQIPQKLDLAGFTVQQLISIDIDKYVIIDLGTINGTSKAHDLNNNGNVTGYMQDGGDQHAYCWDCGQMNDLDPNQAYDNSVGWSINDLKQIAGTYFLNGATIDGQSFLWDDDVFSDLGTMTGASSPAEAFGINGSGQITGYHTLSGGSTDAYVWYDPENTSSYWEDLANWGFDVIAGDRVVSYINESGDLAGYWNDGQNDRAFVASKNKFEDIGLFVDGKDTYLLSINENGQAVGYCDDANDIAIICDSTGIKMSLGADDGQAKDINNNGQVVGTYKVDDSPKAFTWKGGHVYDLNQQLALQGSGSDWWDMKYAEAINEKGQIVGYGDITVDSVRETHAFRLDPVPFTVSDPNVILWLRSDTGVVRDTSDKVSRWIDQTFNGNDITVSDSNSMPLWTTDLTCCNPVIRFDGTDDYLAGTLSSSYTGDSTIFLVINTSASEQGAIFASENGNSQTDAFEITLDGSWLKLSTHQIAPVATESVILEVVIGGTSARYYKNGLPIGSDVIGDSEAKIFTDFVLGKNRAGSNYLGFDVAEVIVFDDDLTDAHRQKVESYLTNKYDLRTTEDMFEPKLWFRADSGVTSDSENKVSLWSDQSGNGFDADQADPNSQPQWQARYDCQPAIKFEGQVLTPPVPRSVSTSGVLLAIDRSGSMGYPQPSEDKPNNGGIIPPRFGPTKEAGLASLAEIESYNNTKDPTDPNHWTGLLTFEADIVVVKQLTEDANSVSIALEGIELPNGINNGCSHKKVIQECIDEFARSDSAQNGLPENHGRVALLLTDGKSQNPWNQVLEKAQLAADAGIQIWLIAIGQAVEDEALWSQIAGITDGGYRAVKDENLDTELAGVFLEILGEIMAKSNGRTLSMVFETGGDVTNRQVLFSEGDVDSGLSLYIDSNDLYCSVWNMEQGAWGYSYISTPIEPNELYDVTLHYRYNDKIAGFINGVQFELPVSSAGAVADGISDHSIGGNDVQIRFHDASVDIDNYFDGYISELLYYDKALTLEKREEMELYLAKKYGFEVKHDTPPVIQPGENITVLDIDDDGLAQVTLNSGINVYDDGITLTYEWSENGQVIAEGVDPIVDLSVGTHVIELKVTDEENNTRIDTIEVTVVKMNENLESPIILGYWPLDNEPNDLSGNGFDTLIVNPDPNMWTDGRIDGAIELNAENQQYIDLNGLDNNVQFFPAGSSQRTIAGWFEAGDNDQATFFDYGVADPNNPGKRFAITASTNKVAVTFGANSHTIGADGLSLKGWHHLAVVFPAGASKSNQVKIYLDGERQSLHAFADNTFPVNIDTNTWSVSSYAYIGRDWQGNCFDGRIDDVRIYSKELVESELPVTSIANLRYNVIDIGSLINKGSTNIDMAWSINNQGDVVGTRDTLLDPNMIYYWRIDENNYNGTIQGDLWDFTTTSSPD